MTWLSCYFYLYIIFWANLISWNVPKSLNISILYYATIAFVICGAIEIYIKTELDFLIFRFIYKMFWKTGRGGISMTLPFFYNVNYKLKVKKSVLCDKKSGRGIPPRGFVPLHTQRFLWSILMVLILTCKTMKKTYNGATS